MATADDIAGLIACFLLDLTHDQLDALLTELDRLARGVDGHEYGLPIWTHKAELREAVRGWLWQQVKQ